MRHNVRRRMFGPARGDTAGALSLVLSDYPYGPEVEDAKVSASFSTFSLANAGIGIRT